MDIHEVMDWVVTFASGWGETGIYALLGGGVLVLVLLWMALRRLGRKPALPPTQSMIDADALEEIIERLAIVLRSDSGGGPELATAIERAAVQQDAVTCALTATSAQVEAAATAQERTAAAIERASVAIASAADALGANAAALGPALDQLGEAADALEWLGSELGEELGGTTSRLRTGGAHSPADSAEAPEPTLAPVHDLLARVLDGDDRAERLCDEERPGSEPEAESGGRGLASLLSRQPFDESMRSIPELEEEAVQKSQRRRDRKT